MHQCYRNTGCNLGGEKQLQTSSFICCVEVWRLRRCDRVQVNVYVNSRDFHSTYNQLFVFLLPTQGFVITKAEKPNSPIMLMMPSWERASKTSHGHSPDAEGANIAEYLHHLSDL